tara:strand:- start:60 stop:221 length:162 start_codon:yes stop_codon:yes gene_type:complete
VAELVDAQDLGSCGATRESSILSFRTKFNGFNQLKIITFLNDHQIKHIWIIKA